VPQTITEDERTSATGLWMFAESYRDAANHLVQGCDLRHDAPIYFLYTHAIELALKAYLRAKGSTKGTVKLSPVGLRRRSRTR
jgi:hypothetical protein